MLTVTDDGSTQRYINNENGSDRKFYKIIRFLKISKKFVQIQIKKKIIVKNKLLDLMQNFRPPF